MFCWYVGLNDPTVMLNARFCQMMSLYSSGNDTDLQFGCPVGQVMFSPWNDAIIFALFGAAETPAGCGGEFGAQNCELADVHCAAGSELARPERKVLDRAPEEAVLSLETMVLLMMFTANESTSEMPAPSQPATLFAMMLLVTVAEYQRLGEAGKRETSVPFTPWKRMPPPLPLSAELPMIRFALITKPGPVPSPRPGAQSTSVVVPHSRP